jgi:hypothetical protein
MHKPTAVSKDASSSTEKQGDRQCLAEIVTQDTHTYGFQKEVNAERINPLVLVLNEIIAVLS